MKLLDFNVFGIHTDALLFDWEELENLEVSGSSNLPEFRYMKENRGVQPSPYRHYALPRDVVDLCSGEDAHKLVDLLKLVSSCIELSTLFAHGPVKQEQSQWAKELQHNYWV